MKINHYNNLLMIAFISIYAETQFHEGDEKVAGNENRRHDIPSRQHTLCGENTGHTSKYSITQPTIKPHRCYRH
jgi:hypothetical protein